MSATELDGIKQLMRERASRGATLLDFHGINWRKKIPRGFDDNDMRSPCCCVIGRAFESQGYHDALLELGILDDIEAQIGCGFELATDDETDGFKGDRWSLLAEAWLELAVVEVSE